MPSLVDQIFDQAQLGTARDPGANPFAQGLQLGLEQQRVNLANRQLAAELAMQPLKQAQMQQQITSQGLAIENQLRDRQNYLNSTAAFTNLANQVSPLLAQGKLEEAQRMVLSAGVSNNFLLVDPRFKSMSSTLEQMSHDAETMKLRLATLDLSKQRLAVSDYRSKPIAERLELDAQTAEANGDPEMASFLRDQATIEKQKLDVRKQELSERARRNDIRQEALTKSLDAASRIAFNSQMRDIENAPHLTLEQRQDAREKAMATFETKAKTRDVKPVSSERVRVKSPDGKIGDIPASQLDSAIKSGYQKLD